MGMLLKLERLLLSEAVILKVMPKISSKARYFLFLLKHTMHYFHAKTKTNTTGKEADILKALDTCLDAALRLIKPGKEASEFQGVLEKICADFNVGLTESKLGLGLYQCGYTLIY